MDTSKLISDRARAIDASGIRRIFQLGAQMDDPINLSIGQPDFPVPQPVRAAAAAALEAGANGYTQTHGDAALLERIAGWLKIDLGWPVIPVGAPGSAADPRVFVSSGTSGALVLAMMALLSPGDECIIPDPYFVCYPHLVTMVGAEAVLCDTDPDFRMTAERVEPLITPRTKFVLVNTPSNPAGVVLSEQECKDLTDLCARKGVLLISDEIYDEFCFDDSAASVAAGDKALPRCPSPARFDGAHEHVLLIRGFGKTYGVTGWRLGYAAGPAAIIAEMCKLQQYTFVCAPTPLQHGAAACFDADMSIQVADYQRRRDLVLDALGLLCDIPKPGGAFYAFCRVPSRLGLTGTQFVEKAIERNVLTIPGGVFSQRDTHFRISYATAPSKLEKGLDILARMMG